MKTQLIESMKRGQHGAMSVKAIAVLVLVLVPLLTIGFYEGRKAYWDAQVREQCAKDGGIKVYETVTLPPERFGKGGNAGIPSRQKATPSDDYFYDNETTYVRQSDPSLWRSYTTMLRRRDGKILGEAVSYHRVGGDVPGPWHPSSFGCPKPIELKLEQSVFVSVIAK